jgi:hypothetical protein
MAFYGTVITSIATIAMKAHMIFRRGTTVRRFASTARFQVAIAGIAKLICC